MALPLHSPLKIKVLLHHHYSPRSWSAEHTYSAEADEATTYWLKEGCLEEAEVHRESGLQLTLRGHQMVEAWMNLALPPRPIKVVPPAPQAVIDALRYVRSANPEVDQVIFRRDGSWEYSDSSTGELESALMVNNLDILRGAAAAAAQHCTLPCIFEVIEEDLPWP